MVKKTAARRGRVPSQKRIIDHLDRMAGISGYVISSRSADKKTREAGLRTQIKEFRPDLIIDPYRGARRRVYEVERVISNNTIFKSLVSLLFFLSKNPRSDGVLVVPDKGKPFATECLGVMSEIIRNYDRGNLGAPIKIRIELASFAEVVDAARRLDKWFKGGRAGKPPKSTFLPRI
jgi:hypothetical protein